MCSESAKDAPSVEGRETTALGAAELHEDRAVVDVLHSAALDIDALLLKSQPRLAKHVREELLRKGGRCISLVGLSGGGVETATEVGRTSACMSLRPPRNLPMGVRSDVTICAGELVSLASNGGVPRHCDEARRGRTTTSSGRRFRTSASARRGMVAFMTAERPG